MTKQQKPPTDRRVEKVQTLADRPGTPGEAAAANAALVRMTAKGRRSKRRITPRLVTATCQYPDDSPLHTFGYSKTTKPQVYCPPHRDGWIDDDGFSHGGERNVRVIRDPETSKVIGRRLVVEEHAPVESVIGQLRQAGAQWLQRLGLPMLGDLHPDADVPEHTGKGWGDPFQWIEVDRVESPGIVAVTSAIALEPSQDLIGDGEQARPRPRFDPALVRLLTTEEREDTPLSLDMDMTAHGRDGDISGSVTLIDLLADDPGRSLAAPGVLPDPPQEPPLIPDASQLHVAIARLVLGIADRDTLRWVRTRRDADPTKYAEVRDQVLIVMDSRREIPVLDSEGPPQRRLAGSREDQI